MQHFSSKDLEERTEDVLKAAETERVVLTRTDGAQFVLMSLEQMLRHCPGSDSRRALNFEEMADDEAEELIAQLEKCLEADKAVR